jgi:hypothetical protein
MSVKRSPATQDSVLLLDFDLEAPGVDEFECLRPPSPDQPGLVEYVREYLEKREGPDIQDFVYPAKGCFVMRAGRRDAAYRQFLSRLDWNKFYSKLDGFLFFENLRAAARAELGCNYLLVDSRTGLGDIGGVCTGHLADAVVLVFQANSAHREGMGEVVAALREREKREGHPIPRLYVASMLPLVPARYDDEFREIPEELKSFVKDLIQRWEGRDVEVPGLDLEDEAPAYGLTNVCYKVRTPLVREQMLPDSFLWSTEDVDLPARLKMSVPAAGPIPGWICHARAMVQSIQETVAEATACCRLMDSSKSEGDYREFFHSLPAHSFESIISDNAEMRRMLRRQPPDKLAFLLPEGHRGILKAWRRPKKT